MNLLGIVNAVLGRIGFPLVSAAYSSTDPQIIQLVALANEEGQDLASRRIWQALVNEGSFTTVATADQGALDGSIVPTVNAFDFILNDTIFNRSTKLPVVGPLAARTYQARLALPATGPVSQYRIRGNHLLFNPAPAASQSCYFEYKTRNWLTNVTGVTPRENWGADTDIPVLDSRLMILGLKWRWKAAKGLEYAEDMQTYENNVADAMAKDGTRNTLHLDGEHSGVLDPVVIVPSGSWPL